MDQGEKGTVGHNKTRVPLTHIHRILKRGIPQHGKASKDAKQAVQEALQDFIRFVTSEANTICRRDKRKVVGGDDILDALQNLGMNMYYDVLREYQKNYRRSLTAPSRRDRMSPTGQEGVNDHIDYFNPDGFEDQMGSDRLDGGLPDNVTGIQKSSTSDENSDPDVMSGIKNMSTSKTVGEKPIVGAGYATPYKFLAMRRALGEVDIKSTNEAQLR